MPAPLDYGTREAKRGRVLPLLGVGALAGARYFRFADFYAYVGTGPQRFPKFEMPLWWKIGKSVVVTAVATVAAGVFRMVIRRLFKRRLDGGE